MNSIEPLVSENKQGRRISVQAGRSGQSLQPGPNATVFVVDDDPAVRQTLQLLMESAGLRAECFASAEEFQVAFDVSSQGCVVLDMSLPGMSGIALLEEFRSKGITTPVIFFTGSDDATLEARAIKAGARDYCAKSWGPVALLASVRNVLQADRRVPQEIDLTHKTSLRTLELTPREREVFELLVSGNGNQQVAALLRISAKTVATHRASLMRKTQSDSLATLTSHWHEYKSCR